jgi:hypothetical protein
MLKTNLLEEITGHWTILQALYSKLPSTTGMTRIVSRATFARWWAYDFAM